MITKFFSEDVIQALCRTLVHSLWQGLLIALLAALALVFTKRSSASVRYHLLVALLCCLVFGFILTFIIELQNEVKPGVLVRSGPSPSLSGIVDYTFAYVQAHAGIIIFIWLIIISLRGMRILFNMYMLGRMKKVKVRKLAGIWQLRLTELAGNMGARRAVTLLESGITKVPLVIGYLKPVILIPIGLVNALNQQEVEAILMHELAHIKRRDYLINLLQVVAETFLFFNPAVLWLSSLIRAEREHCCDDIVVGHTRNKIAYIHALVHFEEYRLGSPGHALAFSGKNGSVLQRLERMTHRSNRSLNRIETIILSLLLVFSSLLIAARSGSGLMSTANKIVPVPISPALKKYYFEQERAARIRYLEQKEAKGTADKSEALELLRYQHKKPVPASQSQDRPISPELRKYIHDREIAAANHTAPRMTAEFKNYIIEKDLAAQRRLREEAAARQRARPKDSIP